MNLFYIKNFLHIILENIYVYTPRHKWKNNSSLCGIFCLINSWNKEETTRSCHIYKLSKRSKGNFILYLCVTVDIQFCRCYHPFFFINNQFIEVEISYKFHLLRYISYRGCDWCDCCDQTIII